MVVHCDYGITWPEIPQRTLWRLQQECLVPWLQPAQHTTVLCPQGSICRNLQKKARLSPNPCWINLLQQHRCICWPYASAHTLLHVHGMQSLCGHLTMVDPQLALAVSAVQVKHFAAATVWQTLLPCRTHCDLCSVWCVMTKGGHQVDCNGPQGKLTPSQIDTNPICCQNITLPQNLRHQITPCGWPATVVTCCLPLTTPHPTHGYYDFVARALPTEHWQCTASTTCTSEAESACHSPENPGHITRPQKAY
jgi:hypothetical protein